MFFPPPRLFGVKYVLHIRCVPEPSVPLFVVFVCLEKPMHFLAAVRIKNFYHITASLKYRQSLHQQHREKNDKERDEMKVDTMAVENELWGSWRRFKRQQKTLDFPTCSCFMIGWRSVYSWTAWEWSLVFGQIYID
jgi:hypothetical protein